jgi:hypothetical protein
MFHRTRRLMRTSGVGLSRAGRERAPPADGGCHPLTAGIASLCPDAPAARANGHAPRRDRAARQRGGPPVNGAHRRHARTWPPRTTFDAPSAAGLLQPEPAR